MTPAPNYRLITKFENTFRGNEYRHRSSTKGDLIALEFYEDLYALGRSAKLIQRINEATRVVNTSNARQGIKARRGDGTFGELVPGLDAKSESGYSVPRGKLATVEIGIEVKILAKAMIKQIDRVMTDLRGQVSHFKRGVGHPISIGIVGVNHAPEYTSFEGDRTYLTDGKRNKHPIQEASAATSRLVQDVASHFDEFLILPFSATNVLPYPFEWVNQQKTLADYGAILTRVSIEYDKRF